MSRTSPLYFNPDEPMAAQELDWTCSACSLAWMNRALAIDYATTEWEAVEYIGTPQNINSTYGLMDSSGTALMHCLIEQGAPAFCRWPTWDQLYGWCYTNTALIGGIDWCHWVAVRYSQDDHLWIANSAQGYMQVTNVLSREDFDRLGPFAAVCVPLLTNFPPPPPESA